MHCYLLVPHLLPALEDATLRELAPGGLATLLKYGIISKTAGKSTEDWLCAAFGIQRQQDTPLAPLSLLGDGGKPGDSYWLRADPVTIQLIRNRLLLFSGSANAPSPQETAELIEALNRHFSPDGLHFIAPHPRRWYLRLPNPPRLETSRLKTYSPAQVNGRNIQHFLPSGADGAYWRSLLNEAQVLLHAHPLNSAREASGMPLLNSIWPWGGGILPEKVCAPYSQVITDDPLARGLAIAATLPCAPLSAGLPLGSGQDNGAPLLVLEAMHDTPRQCLEHWDRDWFKPALTALRQGKIKRLSVVSPDESTTLELTLTRLDLWKFWRGAARRALPLKPASSGA